MTPIFLAAYILIWPLIVAGVLIVLVRGFYRDWRQARRDGRMLI